MKKAKVPIHGTQNSTVTVEHGATVGARFGENVYDEQGNVLSLAALIAMAQGTVDEGQVSISAWEVLLNIPPNVKALENATGSTGIFSVTGPSTGALRTMLGPKSVKIADAGGVLGPPSFELDGDEVAPAANNFYGTDAAGARKYNLFGDGELAQLPGATYRSLQDFVNVMHSPGLIEGGDFLSASAGDLVVDGGTMMIRVLDDNVSALVFADFPGDTVTIPADSMARFIGVEYNAGSPQIVVKTTNTWDQDTEFPLGTCANDGTFMFPLYNPFKVGDPITNIIQRFDAQAAVIRDSYVGGLALANVATRTATLTQGVAWLRINDSPITAKNSSTQPLIGVRPGPGGAVQLTPGFTQWPNTQYTDPTGTLVTMGNNKWAVLWFFVNVGTNAWGFAYGTDEYNNASSAQQEAMPSYLSPTFLASNLLLGRMLFEKNVDTPIVESAFTRVFNGAALADHNQLSNLQGGQLAEYYHLTAAQHALVAALATAVGLPSYTVGTLPSAAGSPKLIYVSDESGGAVPAFSDGTNWRRVTDRNVVT